MIQHDWSMGMDPCMSHTSELNEGMSDRMNESMSRWHETINRIIDDRIIE